MINQNKFINKIIASLPHPFYVIDTHDYTIIMGNPASGFKSDGQKVTCHGMTHQNHKPCQGKEHACPLQIVKKTKKSTIVEHMHHDKDGNERILEVHARYFSTLLVIFLFSLLSTTSFAAQNTWRVLRTAKDTILIASEPGYPPFCIVDEDGNADGFSVDLIKAVAEVMHLNIQIKVGPWAEIKQELVEGKIDALPLVGRSPEREEIYDFTFPYHTMRGAVFVRKGTKGIEILDDLKQKDIAVMEGDNAHEYVTRVKLSDKIHPLETYDIAFRQLAEGKYDAVIAQELMGLQLVNELNIHNVKALPIELTDFNQDFSFAVQEGNKKLLAILNEGLSIIIANGTYDELHKKWWSPIDLHNLSFEDKFTMLLPYIIGIFMIIAIIAIVILEIRVKKRTRKLRKEITARKQAEEKLKSLLKEKEVLIKEVHHRVKNNFAVVSSLLGLQSRDIDDTEVKTMFMQSRDRINSMALLHERLYQSQDLTHINFSEYIRTLVDDLFNAYETDPVKISFITEVDDIILDVDKVLPCGLIVNELISNALKYGFPKSRTDKGQIKVSFHKINEDEIELTVMDNGVGLPDDFDIAKTKSLGLQIVSMMAEGQLDGKLKVSGNSGATFQIQFVLHT